MPQDRPVHPPASHRQGLILNGLRGAHRIGRPLRGQADLALKFNTKATLAHPTGSSSTVGDQTLKHRRPARFQTNRKEPLPRLLTLPVQRPTGLPLATHRRDPPRSPRQTRHAETEGSVQGHQAAQGGTQGPQALQHTGHRGLLDQISRLRLRAGACRRRVLSLHRGDAADDGAGGPRAEGVQ